jgi:hypothetical protein
MGELTKSFGYNYIQDIGSGWILWKNANIKPAGSFMIKNAMIEFGYDSLQNKVKIRRLGYSKAEYTEEDIKHIAEMTVNCPFCKIGKPLQNINLNNNELITYINNNYTKREDNNMPTMTDFLDEITKMPDLNERVVPQIYSRLINLGLSIGIPNDIIRLLFINLGGGLTGLMLNEFFMDESTDESRRLKNELRVFFGNFMTNAIPNLDIEKLGRDFMELVQVARFGNPLDALKTLFQSPLEQIQATIRNITRQLGFGGGGGNPLMFQAPGQIRGARRPEFPIPFGRQVATTGFRLPDRSPLTKPGLPPQTVSDVQFLSPGRRAAGFRVTETINR